VPFATAIGYELVRYVRGVYFEAGGATAVGEGSIVKGSTDVKWNDGV
jgi:hypothetical protein